MTNYSIKDFLEIPSEVREQLIYHHQKQQEIRKKYEEIDRIQKRLERDIIQLHIDCDHPMRTEKIVSVENEFGNYDGKSVTKYYCPDCRMLWEE